MQAKSENEEWSMERLTRRAGRKLAPCLLVAGIAAVLLVVQLMLLADLVDGLVFRHRTFDSEKTVMVWVLLAAGGRCVFQWGADILSARVGVEITSAVRRDLLAHLFHVGPVGLVGRSSGELAATLVDATEALEPYVAHYIPRAALMMVLPLLILAVVFRVDGWSFAILVCTGPLIPVFMALVGYRAQAVMDRQWTQFLCLGSAFLDFLQGMTTLRLFGRTREAVRAISVLSDDYRRTTMSVMKIAFLTTATLEFFASLSIALVAVVLGTRLLAGTAEFRSAFLILLLVPEYFAPLRAFSASYHARQNAVSACTKIVGVFALPELMGAEQQVTEKSVSVSCLSCENLSARYDADGPEILAGVNASFCRGQLTVLTGSSGVGKTTLIRLLLGQITPSAGCIISLDDKGRESKAALSIGWVPQRPHFFQGSIAANLRLAAPDATDAQLREAAGQADALAFIEATPEGFETVIGDNGIGLSGGQGMRLALARALLRNSSVLLLDEPTAGLDGDSQARVIRSIRQNVTGRIVIVATHRAEMMQVADHVLHVSGGTVTDVRTLRGVVA
ncbi:thiol reductant ABC exporter subunit CydD [Acetobacter conturbans]|nr:thiol reductant ABC exporter subunit CydD [Acetobacter conturbans]